jgi:hypothetical protein
MCRVINAVCVVLCMTCFVFNCLGTNVGSVKRICMYCNVMYNLKDSLDNSVSIVTRLQTG